MKKLCKSCDVTKSCSEFPDNRSTCNKCRNKDNYVPISKKKVITRLIRGKDYDEIQPAESLII